jgi:hypothetical protein
VYIVIAASNYEDTFHEDYPTYVVAVYLTRQEANDVAAILRNEFFQDDVNQQKYSYLVIKLDAPGVVSDEFMEWQRSVGNVVIDVAS